jgi:concanavalin A-like lectin/glucanase superfamily protein
MSKSGLLLASMALALLLAGGVARAELMPAAYWGMDETQGPMLDSSPNGNDGTPTNVLRPGDGVSTYGFDGSTSHVPVPDAASLDPQNNDIALTARVMVRGASLDDDSYDVVRKGFVDTPGGDYKMEIKRVARDPSVGKLHCFFRGTKSVFRVANRDIVDGRWHTLECVKTSNSVVAQVDGRSFTTTGSAGSIANASGVMVGAKKATPFDDVFDGSMDFVSIEIAR